MTNADKRQEERLLDDERCVDGLLAEAGLPVDAELRAVLLELRNLRVTEVPEPSAEVAALLGQPGPADAVRLADWPRKHPKKKRAIFTTLAVAASLGVAGGAAAGNDTLRSTAEGTISSIVGSLFPSSPPKPAPAPPSPAPEPALAPTPAPAVVLPAPAGSAPVTKVSGAEPSSPGERLEVSQAPKPAPQVPDGRETGPGRALGQTGDKPVQTGGSRAPEATPADEWPGSGPPGSEPPAGGGEEPGNGNANGKARNDAGSQDAGEPKPPTAKGSGR